MRKSLVARFAFGLTLFAGIGAWIACGGSDPQDVVSPDAGGDSTNNRPDVPEEPPFDAGPPKDAARDVITIPQRDAGTPIILYPEAGPYAEAGIACYQGGELELEPNDDKTTANPLRPIRCGVVEIPDDGGAPDADVEWLTFNVHDAATGFFLQYEGNVKVFVETDGMAPVDITLADASIPVFTKDQPYFVQVHTGNGKTQFWKIILFEEPKPQ